MISMTDRGFFESASMLDQFWAEWASGSWWIAICTIAFFTVKGLLWIALPVIAFRMRRLLGRGASPLQSSRIARDAVRR